MYFRNQHPITCPSCRAHLEVSWHGQPDDCKPEVFMTCGCDLTSDEQAQVLEQSLDRFEPAV